jgi:pilus assembly protein Flp/PilA
MQTFEMAILFLWALAAAGSGRARRWLAREARAQSTVEYALIGALIVVIASVAVGLLGGQVKDVFEQMTNALKIGGSAK